MLHHEWPWNENDLFFLVVLVIAYGYQYEGVQLQALQLRADWTEHMLRDTLSFIKFFNVCLERNDYILFA